VNPLLAKNLRYYGLFRPLAGLPLPLAYGAAGLIGRFDCRRNAAARAAVERGLQQAFPDLARVERVVWTRRYFEMLAREMLDVFTMPARTPVNSERLLRLRRGSLEVLHEARGGGRGVIIAMAHYGRLNMLLLALALAGERLGMLTMVTDERNRDLDPVDRVYLDRKIRTLLGFIRGSWITLGDDLRRLYQALEAGETLVLLFDAYDPERRIRPTAPFLGGELGLSSGIARLARRTGARVVYGVAHQPGWSVEAELRRLPDDPGAALAAAVRELEHDVRAAPWLWWHWNILELIWTPHSPRI
jgi:lauroyl/myristoyl acyltransferase